MSRFEGFPTKKLEALRTAAALYRKLDNIITELQNWKIETPIGQLLDKLERHFNKVCLDSGLDIKLNMYIYIKKLFISYRQEVINYIQIKREVDALERTKDEESKKFQSQNIHFDFNILIRIKESMVDVSSSCMDLALKVHI